MVFTQLILFGSFFVVCVMSKKDECYKGESCAYLGKADGWDVEREMESYSLIHPPVSDSWKDPKTTIYLTMASYRLVVVAHSYGCCIIFVAEMNCVL